jgi:NAD-dependent SIR2 family protein deacetylase
MYFDTVRCTSCQNQIDPDRIPTNNEGVPFCPSCKTPLDLKSLFGLKDSFLEEDEENVTFDDLVPGFGQPKPGPRGRPQADDLEGLVPYKKR